MIHIGLINNMSGSALEATERRFRSLLNEAAGARQVRLSLFSLPEVRRPAGVRHRMANAYSSLEALWNGGLDGIIVTGAEPAAANLQDEPYWASLTRVIDWAEHNTYSAVWSCLAAHAAVLRMDGIERRPLSDKRFGVFECVKAGKHPLTSGLPGRLWIPHSRWNDLPEAALSACGYRVLTRSDQAGVDLFIKQRNSLFVFLQGHPEYEAETLLLEHRRDVRRFQSGESAWCPAPFAASESISWRPGAVRFFRNWLHYLTSRKEEGIPCRPTNIESGVNALTAG